MFKDRIFDSGRAFQHNSVLSKKKNAMNNSYQNLKLSTFEIQFSPVSLVTCKKTVRWCYSQLALRRTPLGPALSVLLREVSIL